MDKLLAGKCGFRKDKIIFFNMFILIFTVSKAWGLDSTNKSYYLLAAVAMVFWVFALLGTKYEMKEMLLCGLLLVVSAISLYCSGKIGAILPAMVIVVAKDTLIDDVIKMMMKCWLVTVAVKVIGVIIGVIPNEIIEKTTELALGSDSYKMGYGHPNLFAMAVAICTLLVLYTYWDNIKWWWSLIIIAVAIAVFMVSLSFTGTAVMVIASGGVICKAVIMKSEILSRIVNLIMLAVSIASMIVMFVFTRMIGISESLDIILLKYTAHRTHVSRSMMDVYSVKLFGQRFDSRAGYEMLDNAYVYTLLQLGVIMFCLMVMAYLCCLLGAYRRKDISRLFILTILIIYGFMEQSFINPFINFSWLFIADMIWNDKVIQKPTTRDFNKSIQKEQC